MELRSIETNVAGEENAGSPFRLRYDVLWFGLSGVGASFVLIAALYSDGQPSKIALILSCLPAALTLGLAVYRQSHPPGYDLDLLDLLLHGPGFGPKPPEEEP